MEISQIVMVPILADDNLEGIEQFTAMLSLPAGQVGVVLGANMATVEITDDDCKLAMQLKYSQELFQAFCMHSLQL